MTQQQETRPAEVMLQMIGGFWAARALNVAATLGIADLLGRGPKTASELAQATRTHAPSLYRLLRALCSVGVFAEKGEGRFDLTPLGETLRSDAPDSMRALVMSELGGVHYPAWGELLYSVQTGRPSFDKVFGKPVFDYFAEHPEQAQIFNRSMTELTRLVEPAVLEAYDFSPFKRVVDVGGGHGSLLASILKRNPHLEGVVYDAPQVVEGARARFEAEGLGGRARAVGGDFFASVPEGGDAYLMKHIIHDWDDERCVRLLDNCRRVMPEGGKLIVIDQVVPPGDAPSTAKFSDLIMLIMVGGRERTAEEFRALFARTGLNLTRIVETQSPVCLIEGVKA